MCRFWDVCLNNEASYVYYRSVEIDYPKGNTQAICSGCYSRVVGPHHLRLAGTHRQAEEWESLRVKNEKASVL